MMQTYSLDDARQAASQLQALQDAASQLPTLERQEAKAQSLNRLETMRRDTQVQINQLYSEYNAAYDAYRLQFDNLLSVMRETAQSLKALFDLRKRITDKIQQYAGSRLQHSLTLEGKDVYKDGQLITMQAEKEVSQGLVLERQLTPNNANQTFGILLRLLQGLI
ncbi:MAG TPA: hypothetical protein PKH77_01915 [Anaerolineae bacterium]|nr:hypothetical protein [Anaerolineae bacterium]